MQCDEGLRRLEALGFDAANAALLWEHFDDAESRGKLGHGHSRVPWLETLDGYDPKAEPELVVDDGGFQRWNGNGAIGYLVLAHVVGRQIADPPAHARVVQRRGQSSASAAGLANHGHSHRGRSVDAQAGEGQQVGAA